MIYEMLDGELYGEPFYLPYLLYAYIHYYSMGPLTDYIIPEFASLIPSLFGGSYSGGYINDYMNDNGYNPPIHCMLSNVVEDFETNENHALRQLLVLNDLYDWTPESTTYLFHALADELVPYENSVMAYDTFIENGANEVYLELIPEEYGGHQEAAPFAVLTAYTIGKELQLVNPKGDVTHDGSIDVTDIVRTVEIIMEWAINLDNYALWSADMNADLIVDVLDIISMVNFILNA